MEKNAVCKIRDEVAFRKSSDGTLTAVSPVSDKIVTLNRAAADIWGLIDGKRTVDGIIAAFMAEFDPSSLPPKSHVESDVIEIIEQFLNKELIEFC